MGQDNDFRKKIHPFDDPYDIFIDEIPAHYRHIEDIKTRYEGVDYVVGHYKHPDGLHSYFIPSQICTPSGWLMLMGGMNEEQNDDAQSRLDLMLPVAIKYTLRWEKDHVLAQKLWT